MRKIEVPLAIQQYVDVARADRQQVNAGFVHERRRLTRIGERTFGCIVPFRAEGQHAQLRFHSHAPRMRQTHQFRHAAGEFRVVGVRVGKHHQVETEPSGMFHPSIRRTFIEHQRARNTGRFGRRASQGPVPLQPGRQSTVGTRQKLSVKTDDHRRAALLRGVDHALQRREIPRLEVTQRIAVTASVGQQFGSRFKRHDSRPPEP